MDRKEREQLIDKNQSNFNSENFKLMGYTSYYEYFIFIQEKLNTNISLLQSPELMKELKLDKDQLLEETKSLHKISSLIKVPEYDSEPKRKSFFSR